MIKEFIYKLFGQKFGDSTMYAIANILGIKNIAGNQINPATSDNQTNGSQKTQVVDGVGVNIDFAKETTQLAQLTEQQQLEIIASTIQELVARLDFLPSVRGIAADLRVTLLSGVVTTVSTVTTVTTVGNQTSIGGYIATPIIPATQNNIAVISNIQNVV